MYLKIQEPVNMKLEKPIIFFDIESTGVEINTARIIELACIKYHPDGTQEEKTILVNPEILIPPESSEVHGITDDMVKDLPVFKQYAQAIRKWFDGCDLAGFNSDKYDVPLLSAEFERAGLEGIIWNPSLHDILIIYRKLFPNTLSAIYKRLTGKELEGAHGAVFDIQGTKEIANILLPMLIEQAETPIETIKDVDEYLQGETRRFDLNGNLYKDKEGIVRYNFGKDKNLSVVEYPGFANWMLSKEFPAETKTKIKELLNK